MSKLYMVYIDLGYDGIDVQALCTSLESARRLAKVIIENGGLFTKSNTTITAFEADVLNSGTDEVLYD